MPRLPHPLPPATPERVAELRELFLADEVDGGSRLLNEVRERTELLMRDPDLARELFECALERMARVPLRRDKMPSRRKTPEEEVPCTPAP